MHRPPAQLPQPAPRLMNLHLAMPMFLLLLQILLQPYKSVILFSREVNHQQVSSSHYLAILLRYRVPCFSGTVDQDPC